MQKKPRGWLRRWKYFPVSGFPQPVSEQVVSARSETITEASEGELLTMSVSCPASGTSHMHHIYYDFVRAFCVSRKLVNSKAQ